MERTVTRPAQLNREDPVLGLVRLCRGCGDEWPLDDEFWYFQTYRTAGGVKRCAYPVCRACWLERNARAHESRRHPRIVIEGPGDAAHRREWKNAYDRAVYASLTPEQRAERNAKRAAWRKARRAARCA